VDCLLNTGALGLSIIYVIYSICDFSLLPHQVKMNVYDPVAYFAHIKRPPGMSKATFCMVKLRYMHAALRRIVEPLVKMGLFGQVRRQLSVLNFQLGASAPSVERFR
jgi:hypothetical protein